MYYPCSGRHIVSIDNMYQHIYLVADVVVVAAVVVVVAVVIVVAVVDFVDPKHNSTYRCEVARLVISQC